MEKFKTGVIFVLSLAVAYGCGVATTTHALIQAEKDLMKNRSKRSYVSYRDYRERP